MPRCVTIMPPSGKRRREKRCGRSALVGERHCVVHADAAELARHELRKTEEQQRQRHQEERKGATKRRTATTASVVSAPPRLSPPRPAVTPPRHSPPRPGASSPRLSPPKNRELPSPVNRIILQHLDVNELEEIGAGGGRRRGLPRSPGLERDFRRLETESDAKTCATDFRRLYASYLDQELRRDAPTQELERKNHNNDDDDDDGVAAAAAEESEGDESDESEGETESKEERKLETQASASPSRTLSLTPPSPSPSALDTPDAMLQRVVCLADARAVTQLIQRYIDDTAVACRNSRLGPQCTIGVNAATTDNSFSFAGERKLAGGVDAPLASIRVDCRLYATLVARGTVGGWTFEINARLPDRNAFVKQGEIRRDIEWKHHSESARQLRAAPYRAFARFMTTALEVAQPDSSKDTAPTAVLHSRVDNRWLYIASAADIDRAVRVFARLVQAVRYAFADVIVLTPSPRDTSGPARDYVQLLQTAFPGVPVRLLFGYYMTSGSRQVDVPDEWDPRKTTLPPGVGIAIAKPGR